GHVPPLQLLGERPEMTIQVHRGAGRTRHDPDDPEVLAYLHRVQGALVGGASLDPRSFAQIVQAALPNDV
ncbi:MAG TPA: triose-phosphate isomerase, partial [Chthoniobacterales bacterium]